MHKNLKSHITKHTATAHLNTRMYNAQYKYVHVHVVFVSIFAMLFFAFYSMEWC